MLLQLGAPVNKSDHTQTTPLHYAAYHGANDCVELLLAHEANPNFVDDAGNAALHEASRSGKVC